jgi:hypothetical protein
MLVARLTLSLGQRILQLVRVLCMCICGYQVGNGGQMLPTKVYAAGATLKLVSLPYMAFTENKL